MESHGIFIKPTSNDFFAISKLLIKFAESTQFGDEDSSNGLIIPISPERTQRVQKDGPGGKGKTNVPPVMSLRSVNGELYVVDNGQVVEKGYFEYHHISSAEMTTILKLGNDPTHESPTLVPLVESDHPDGTKLSKHNYPKQETPTSETVNLLGVEYGNTLALEYSDDPKDTHAKLVILPQHELKQIMEDMEKGKKMIFKTNPVIKIRTLVEMANPSASSDTPNNIALYFETSRFYYYIHVDSTVNPPILDLKPTEKTKAFDPHKDFVRHLQFVERAIVKGEDGKLATLAEDQKDGPEIDDLPDINSLNLVSRSESDPVASIPTVLQFLSEPSNHNDRNLKEKEKEVITNDSATKSNGSDLIEESESSIETGPVTADV
ncbi:uncharacterized protein LOC135331018 [Halichondria panicea]|uniref:uncharacterized protein LOC135331018 n=1 Tax=Halichondria panicea TaxID=6063 RepID=UPI00312B9402